MWLKIMYYQVFKYRDSIEINWSKKKKYVLLLFSKLLFTRKTVFYKLGRSTIIIEKTALRVDDVKIYTGVKSITRE